MESPTSPYVGPPAPAGNTLPLTPPQQELIKFLATAPRLWSSPTDPPVRKFKMANGEEISCVFWKGRFFITGTDIVKILIFHFQQMGRGILNPKKFEEGVFSDLRNLKPGVDAVLEEPRSEFLEFLHKHGCIRTQKKQKVFFWNQVPHEDLLREALERQMKRVTSAFHMTHMMNSPELLKHYMMMPGVTMMSPGVQRQMMPMMAPTGPLGATHPYMFSPNGMNGMHMLNSGLASANNSLASPIQAPPIPNPPLANAEAKTHPRRTISLSAVDFTPRPQMAMNPAHMDMAMPEISSALSSPMFSSELDLNGDSYFDLGVTTPIDSPLGHNNPLMALAIPEIPQQSEERKGESNAEKDAPSPGVPAEEPNVTLRNLENDLGKEFDALTAPPSEMLFDSNDLLGGMWSYDKTSTLDSPLWDDLSMMIPNAEPNLRGSQ